jgi:hypothetical protein
MVSALQYYYHPHHYFSHHETHTSNIFWKYYHLSHISTGVSPNLHDHNVVAYHPGGNCVHGVVYGQKLKNTTHGSKLCRNQATKNIKIMRNTVSTKNIFIISHLFDEMLLRYFRS